MTLRRTTLSLVASLLIVSSAASARADGAADKAALASLNRAMNTEFLETRFDDAEQTLRKAIAACASSKCTPAVHASLYMGLGSVLAGGKKELDDARDAFVEGLKLSSAAAPDPNVATGEVTFAYERARKDLKLDAPRPEPRTQASQPGADIDHTPPAEQQVRTPVPLYVKLAPALSEKAATVRVSYRPSGGDESKSFAMRKLGDGAFGLDVSCADVTSVGTLRYHILVLDPDGAVLGQAGSEASPLTVPIRASISAEAPHWPGYAPPVRCSAAIEDKGPQQCIDDGECNSGLVCVGGMCERPPEGAGEPVDKVRRNWISLSFAPDISFISGTDVCSTATQQAEHFACFRENGDRYVGTPLSGKGRGNTIRTGAALSTMRLMLGYDRVILDNFTVGARLGYAFGGASGKGASFMPVHAEARAAYWFGKEPFGGALVRPFVMVSGGLAQIDTAAEVPVAEAGATPDAITVTPLTAYKQAGLGFVGGSVGLAYAPTETLALRLGVRGSVTLPVVTAVISPELGFEVGF